MWFTEDKSGHFATHSKTENQKLTIFSSITTTSENNRIYTDQTTFLCTQIDNTHAPSPYVVNWYILYCTFTWIKIKVVEANRGRSPINASLLWNGPEKHRTFHTETRFYVYPRSVNYFRLVLKEGERRGQVAKFCTVCSF